MRARTAVAAAVCAHAFCGGANGGRRNFERKQSGEWTVLASVCYPADMNGADKMYITATPKHGKSHQKIVLYDDESISFARALTLGSCEARIQAAKPLKIGGKARNYIDLPVTNFVSQHRIGTQILPTCTFVVKRRESK